MKYNRIIISEIRAMIHGKSKLAKIFILQKYLEEYTNTYPFITERKYIIINYIKGMTNV